MAVIFHKGRLVLFHRIDLISFMDQCVEREQVLAKKNQPRTEEYTPAKLLDTFYAHVDIVLIEGLISGPRILISTL